MLDQLYNKQKELFTDVHSDSLSSDDLKIKSREVVKMIKSYVKVIRSSPEYRKFIKFLKFTKDISFDIIDDANDIEYHHAPFSLFDITTVILKKQIYELLSISTFTIAKTVMELHYNMMVGLIPLPSSIHNNVESNNILIPPDLIFGNWDKFVKEYYQYFTSEVLEKYNNYKAKFYSNSDSDNPDLELNRFLENYSAKPTDCLLLSASTKNVTKMIGK